MRIKVFNRIKISSYNPLLSLCERIKIKCFYRRLDDKVRAYNKLKNQNQLGIIRILKGKCTEISFKQINKYASKYLFGVASIRAELATIQFLLQHLFLNDFEERIIITYGIEGKKLVHPLPKEYLNVLSSYEISISFLKSKLNWAYWIIKQWLFGIIIIGKIILDSLIYLLSLSDKKKIDHNSAYFHGLRSSNLPQDSTKNYDIFTWYIKKNPENSVKVCYHSIAQVPDIFFLDKTISYIGKSLFYLTSWKNFFRFLAWLIIAIPLTFWNVCIFRWWNVILLGEFARLKIFQLKEKEEISKEYLFHYSLNIFRPLWTYEVESKGAKVVSYFYSGYEFLKLPEGYADQKWEFGRTNWPFYLVWDEWQKELVSRELINPSSKFQVVGPILFETSVKTLSIPKRSISVFDYQQHRKAFHLGVSPSSVFFNTHPDLNIRFLNDIQEVLNENGIYLIFKKKRDLGKRAETRYLNLMKKLEKLENVILADAEIPALYLIERTIGTISLPFTSTGLFRRDENFLSIYYDPTGWVDPTDRASHGIPLIQGKAALKKWVLENYKEEKYYNTKGNL